MDWSQLGIDIMSYLLPVIAVIITALASWALTLLAKKLGVQVDMTKDAAIRRAVRMSIGGAEEWAARKMGTDESKKPEGVEKADWVKRQMNSMWPNLLPEELDRYIDEELAAVPGAGATGDAVYQ